MQLGKLRILSARKGSPMSHSKIHDATHVCFRLYYPDFRVRVSRRDRFDVCLMEYTKKEATLWKLMCPTRCWLVWLEQNNRVFNDCKEPAYNVYRRAKEVTCFWGLNGFLMEDYSIVSTLEGFFFLFFLKDEVTY